MGGRFGGVGSRTTLTNLDNLAGIVSKAYLVEGRARVDVQVPTTGKRLLGVFYARRVENEQTLVGQNVQLTRVGGRWVVL